jgi:uncharacterized protein
MQDGPAHAHAPVVRTERISAVDTVRGFALLGILLINIVSFALPNNAYSDPTIAGGATGINLAAWAINYILFEGKMRALFSMLFGAGVVLLSSRLEQRDPTAGVADIYYRRVLWLLAFGLVHAYCLWEGDILYFYAVCGLILFPFRKLRPKTLVLTGLLVLAVLIPKNLREGRGMRSLYEDATAADAAAAAGKTLTEAQRDAQKEWAHKLNVLKPSPSDIEKEIADHRGGYWNLYKRRMNGVSYVESVVFYRRLFFDTAGMMLLGMGLIRLGFFSATRSYREYALTALAGYAVGISINSYVAYWDIRLHFEVVPTLFRWTPYGVLNWTGYDVERLAVALAHASVLLMICKAGLLRWLTSRLAAVGQMALTNYLFDTIVCTTLFNGYGFGLYGKLQRYQVYWVVLAIWVFQLAVSEPWLRHFRFGPAEWLWRSLTYWKLQPMRLAQPAPSVPEIVASSGG